MKKKTIKRLCGGLLALSLLSGCAAPVQTVADEKPIQIALTQDILSFDPIKTTDIFSEAVLRCVYTSLYDFDDDLQLRPKLAKTAVAVDDYTWEIQIHDKVIFQDGSALTTDDVIFSIERAMVGERTQKLLEMVAGVEKIDETTFLLRSKEPYGDLLSLFAKAETSIVSKAVVEGTGYDFTNPVGAGPFSLLSRKEGLEISLKRFDAYYLENAASKYLNFLVIVTEQERTTAFLNGEVDLLFSVSAYDCEKLRLSKEVKLLKAPSTKIEYLSLNTQHPPLDNPKVRLAISHAINRVSIADSVYHGYSAPISSLIPRGVMGYTEEQVSYDPAKAKTLLTQAGYPNGFDFTVITINTIRKNTLEYIKLNLAQVGIQLSYNLVTMQEAVEMMNAGAHDGILVGWAFSANPNSVLPVLLGTGSGKTMNSSNYSNPTVDKLIAQARGESDSQKATKIYEKINRIVTQEAPIVVLQNPMVLSAALTSIEGIHINAHGIIQYESLFRK